jgi:hypothetical protein
MIARIKREGENAMKQVSTVAAAAALVAAIALAGAAGTATAQTSSHVGDIPQSVRLDHENTIAQLTAMSHKRGRVGVEAAKALVLYKKHLQREEEFILPPLTLLPLLADGKVTPDMKWAIAMSDRTAAEREETFIEHTQITDAMNRLLTAARAAHDQEALDFAQGAVADSLNDIEITEPTSILVGQYLKAKLPAQ